SGGSLSLAVASASSTFGQNVTIQAGGTLTVAAGANVQLLTGGTMAVNGTLNFATRGVGTLNNNGNYFQVQINVGSGGLLSSSGATITAPVGNNTNGVNFANINVAAGGRVQASNTTFSVGQVSFAVGAALGAGDLNGDAFDTTLYVPAIGVQYL